MQDRALRMQEKIAELTQRVGELESELTTERNKPAVEVGSGFSDSGCRAVGARPRAHFIVEATRGLARSRRSRSLFPAGQRCRRA